VHPQLVLAQGFGIGFFNAQIVGAVDHKGLGHGATRQVRDEKFGVTAMR
jgi:hypothetical protein